MKTIKSILIAATLICATCVSTVSAQQAAQTTPKHEFKVAIGDSVMIKRECQKYCTGETPSTWVWDKVHTVRQLGTKRFPDGVLLMNIYSWMCEDCLIPVNGKAEESAAKAAEEQKEDKAAFQEQSKAERDSIADAAEKARQAAAAKKAEEEAAAAAAAAAATTAAAASEPAPSPAPAEQVEEKAAETAVAEQAKADSVAPAQQTQTAKGDSIHSKQNFKKSYDRFTIGVRGGVASQLHNAVDDVDAKWKIGGAAILDLQYAHYWAKDGRPVDLGLIVGLGIGYAQGGFGGSEDSTFTKDVMRYTINADVKETDRQIQLEIPLYFSLIHDNGFFFNVGPKFMLPVYTPYKQSIKNEDIVAYDTETGVTFDNNVVTGRYNGEKPNEGNGLQFKINIMLAAELGYEWILKSGNSLGLGVYADYCVYNSYSHSKNASSESLLNLTPPSNSGIATLDVLSATKTYAKNVGYFDVGVKLAYHFNFPKKRYFKASKLF